MRATKYIWLTAVILCSFSLQLAFAAPSLSQWDQAAAAIAEKITGVLGPGQTRLAIRNLSSISADEIPAIRAQLEADLKAHGVSISGAESASSVRVTLSESATKRLWVAEITEGNQVQVVMVDLGPVQEARASSSGGILLRKQMILATQEPPLALLETPGGFLVLEPEQVVFYTRAADGLKAAKQVSLRLRSPLARDPRGVLRLSGSGQEFEAWLAGSHCTGPTSPAEQETDWPVRCSSSDDPWPILSSAAVSPALTTGMNIPVAASTQSVSVKAFYNSARNYFTGVVTPSAGFDVPPFYSAAQLWRPGSGLALLIGGIDGQVRLVENNLLHAVSGTRDWGSDFAVFQSGCGGGEQIIASGSGEAIHDSLRAYELPAFEAIPASAPLSLDGSVTALWASPDGRSVIAAIRKGRDQYEVDRVSALCN